MAQAIEDGVQHAAFFLPVVGTRKREIWLPQRNTPPFEGYFCAAGGKRNVESMAFPFIEHRFVSVSDYFSRQGRSFEAPLTTAVREYCEEMHADRAFPDGFPADGIMNAYTMGYVPDVYNGVVFHNHFSVGELRITRHGKPSFACNAREVRSAKPLSEIAKDEIAPITRAALRYMYEAQRYRPSMEEPVEVIKANLESPLRTVYRDIDLSRCASWDPATFIPTRCVVDRLRMGEQDMIARFRPRGQRALPDDEDMLWTKLLFYENPLRPLR